MHKFFPDYTPRAKRAAGLGALVGGALAYTYSLLHE
jgi:hypothetical protein